MLESPNRLDKAVMIDDHNPNPNPIDRRAVETTFSNVGDIKTCPS
jgi:hypothetical protein